MGKEPVSYSSELAQRILDLIADGETMTDVCKLDGMPTMRAVQYWSERDQDGFRARLVVAQQFGLRVWLDELRRDMKAAKTKTEAAVLRAKIHAFEPLVRILAPKLIAEAPPPPQEHRVILDFGAGALIPMENITRSPPMIEGQAREVRDGD